MSIYPKSLKNNVMQFVNNLSPKQQEQIASEILRNKVTDFNNNNNNNNNNKENLKITLSIRGKKEKFYSTHILRRYFLF